MMKKSLAPSPFGVMMLGMTNATGFEKSMLFITSASSNTGSERSVRVEGWAVSVAVAGLEDGLGVDGAVEAFAAVPDEVACGVGFGAGAVAARFSVTCGTGSEGAAVPEVTSTGVSAALAMDGSVTALAVTAGWADVTDSSTVGTVSGVRVTSVTVTCCSETSVSFGEKTPVRERTTAVVAMAAVPTAPIITLAAVDSACPATFVTVAAAPAVPAAAARLPSIASQQCADGVTSTFSNSRIISSSLIFSFGENHRCILCFSQLRALVSCEREVLS